MQAEALAGRLRAALRPLAVPPADAPWNLDELDGLLKPGVPAEAAVLVGIIPNHAGPEVLLLDENHDHMRRINKSQIKESPFLGDPLLGHVFQNKRNNKYQSDFGQLRRLKCADNRHPEPRISAPFRLH